MSVRAQNIKGISGPSGKLTGSQWKARLRDLKDEPGFLSSVSHELSGDSVLVRECKTLEQGSSSLQA